MRVGAAVGVLDFERISSLIEADVDVLIVDSAHGHSKNVIETVRRIKKDFEIDVVAGNVATFDGARDLIEAGADAVKVGIGPGSICTTRVVSGVGVPQITAVYRRRRAPRTALGAKVPIIADGGIRYSGDITKALAAGAHCVMIGGLFAGLAESPGETIIYRGRSFKSYRGMGSLAAMAKGSHERYRQDNTRSAETEATSKAGTPRPESSSPKGSKGGSPTRGRWPTTFFNSSAVSGRGWVTAEPGPSTNSGPNARFIQVTGASVQEGHPHDIVITQEAPNYSSFYQRRRDRPVGLVVCCLFVVDRWS